MKHLKFMFAVLLSLMTFGLSAQSTRTTWTTTATDLGEGLYEIRVTASIPEDLHIYALGELGGYNPTSITVQPTKKVEVVGEVTPSKEPRAYYDEVFKMDMGDYSGEVTFTQQVRSRKADREVKVLIEWQECTDETCQMGEVEQSVVLDGSVASGKSKKAEVAPAEGSNSTHAGNFWSIIIEAILWGFAALLTPCVFPMVPMTVSFFMKGSENKRVAKFRAAMYGVFIVALYTLPIAALILITKVVGGDAVTADIFNWLATHWLPNIIFFAVFMVFAASFFGAFEIVLPSKLVNKSDENVDKKKGLGGVFFLALTLVLVSFSCTGPIVGSVLIKATQGEVLTPIFAMLAFSLAFALPFVLCALFPGLLNKMPKSGGWLNSVKVVLGFVEVALGFKFLSTADQVYHWGLLDREVYLAIWIVVFTMLGFYLLGKLRFKHDSEVKYISTFRLALAIGVFSFVVYMIPGMWGAPLKALSGYLPPMQTQDFVLGGEGGGTAAAPKAEQRTVKYGDFLELPLGLEGYFDLEEAKEYAAEVGKPIFLDFTGHGCVNCREMEAKVWSHPEVKAKLENDFVICALYMDDKKQVAAEDWVITESGKELKTLGKINSHFASKQFGINAQPYYVILDAEGNQLGDTRGYDLDVAAFVEWMDRCVAEGK
ncbi:MAG: thioredoxin family protein [Tidjanibacter sp.]|nr:thioredoxin family protein [Tidjanibacter sp.]MBR3853296.1 thioredoxin family protein [Tidjanibacter sp.]